MNLLKWLWYKTAFSYSCWIWFLRFHVINEWVVLGLGHAYLKLQLSSTNHSNDVDREIYPNHHNILRESSSHLRTMLPERSSRPLPANKAVGLSWLTRVSWVRNWLESLFLTLSQLESAYLQRYLHFGYHIFIFGIPEWEVGRRRKQENKWFVSSQKWYMLKCQ